MLKKYKIRLQTGRILGPFSFEEVHQLLKIKKISGFEDCQCNPDMEWHQLDYFDEFEEVINKNFYSEKLDRIKKDVDISSETVARMSITNNESEFVEFKYENIEKDTIKNKTLEVEEIEHNESKDNGHKNNKNEENNVKIELDIAIEKLDVEDKENPQEDQIKNEFNEFTFDVRENQEEELDLSSIQPLDSLSIDNDDKSIIDKTKAEKIKKIQSIDEIESGQYPDNKTKVVSSKFIKQQKIIDKTKVLAINDLQKALLEEKSQEENQSNADNKVIKEKPAPVVKEKTIVSYSDKTQVLNIDTLKKLEQEFLESQEMEKVALNEETNEESQNLSKEDKQNNKKNKTRPIFFIVICCVIYLLLFDNKEDKKPLKPIFVHLEKLMIQPELNLQKSNEYFLDGIDLFETGSYLDLIKAYSFFKKSVENNYNNNKAFGYLIYTGALIFNESKNISYNSKIIFKLLQLKNFLKIKDEMYAIGASIFFRKIKRIKTSLYFLDSYLRVNKKLSVRLINEYIQVQIINGDFEKLHNFISKLKSLKYLKKDSYYSLIKYSLIEEDFRSTQKYLKESIKSYPNSIIFNLLSLDFKKKTNDMKHLDNILNHIRKRNVDYRPSYFAKFYEFLGYYYVQKKNSKRGLYFFKKSLKLFHSDSLLSTLSAIDTSGSFNNDNENEDAVTKLILETKVINKMKNIKELLKKKKWNQALFEAINAVDMLPGYIPSNLLLLKIQIKRGYFNEAQKIISKIKELYPLNSKINFTYINLLIESGKLNLAFSEINQLGNKSKLSQSFQYASILAKYYMAHKQFLLSVNWLRESLKRNPVNDLDYYNLAKVFYQNNRFKKSQYNLNKALFLNPDNLDFNILYSKILYELNGVDTAIGYLRNILKKKPQNIKLLSTIAILYYKDGKMKDFDSMRKNIEGLNLSSPSFYKFLINSSKLREDYKNLIKYSYKLSKEDPSDIKNKMLLGEYLYITNRMNESQKVFNSVVERLPKYPRVHYFLAKIFIGYHNLKAAKKEAELEIKYNPRIYYGFFILGETYRRLKQYQKSISNLNKALSLKRTAVEVLNALGWIKLKQHLYNASLEFYLMAKRQEPNNPNIHKNLGMIFQKIGQRKLAAEEYTLYLQLDPAAKDKNKVEMIIRTLQTR